MDRPEDGEGIVRELSGFTPGPWETNEAEHDCPYQDVVIRDTKGRGICRIWFDDAPVPDYNAEQSANARLIKAAPALLARITLDAQEKAALKGQADVLDALNTSQAHEIALLKAELASVKAHAEAMEGLLLLALYHHQGGSSPVGQPIRKALGIGQHDHMTDEQIERGKDAGRAAHPKEGA